MPWLRVLVTVMLVAAFACLIPATIITIAKRRDDLSLKDLFLAGNKLTRHVDRYVSREWVGVVRNLNFAGILLFTTAILIITTYSLASHFL